MAELNLRTERSNISESKVTIELPSENEDSLQMLQFDFLLDNSKISFYDVSQLVPALKGMNQVVELSGEVFGNINDLKGRNLVLNTGRNTSAVLDFYANDISDPENMYLFVDLSQSQTSFQDLSRIKLPQKWGTGYLSFPEPFYEAGIFSYQGNFAGFLTDFVAFGTLSSDMGILSTDLSVRPEQAKQVYFRGEVATENFRLGELVKIKNVGEITFDGSVDGYLNRDDQSVAAAFNGEVTEVVFNRYNYQNIEIDGIFDNRMFDGLIAMNDPNLQFDFLGKINLNPDVPVFDFRVEMQKAMPGKLNLSDNFPNSETSFIMTANFSGDKLDNLAGTIQVEDGMYKNRNGEFSLEGMELQSITSGPAKYLSFTSDFFDVEINGNYHFQNIRNAFQKSMNRYIPAINYEKIAGAQENKFGYQVDVKNLDELMKVFAPGLKIETPFLLYGRLDSEQSVFELKGSIPGFNTNNLAVRNIFISNNPQEEGYASKFRVGEIMLKNGMSLNNVTVSSKISDNTIDNLIEWGKPEEMQYSGRIKTRSVFSDIAGSNYPHVDIEGFPTHIYISDSLWQISPFTASIDSSLITVNNFNFFNENQYISIDGTISQDETDELTASFENIDLSNLSSYLNRDLPVQGLLNGTASIRDFYNQRLLFSDLNISDFFFKEQKIGDVKLANNWDNLASVLNSEITITNNGRKSLIASGHYNPKTNIMDYDATVNKLSLVILETAIRKAFSNIHGDASGKVRIHGSPQKLLLTGALEGNNAGLTIDFTQVSYVFTDTVYFRGDTIHFDQIAIRDISGNRGTFDGTIVHTNFQDMIYDLEVRSPKIVAINTTLRNNEQFFGKVIANGQLAITGRGKQVNLTGSATTLSGTAVNISLANESEIERYDFIQFVSSQEDEEDQEFSFPEEDDGDFSLNLTIRATPEARAQLIYNSQIGDVIRAQGEGLLVFGMDNEENITLSGNYTVEQGDYLFTLQNVINKRFTIEQGGTIDWSGDPYDATIDINAVYRLKASLYDLLVNTYDNIYQNQRIPVECKILLSEDLSNPDIDFEIDFPSVENRLIDEIRQFFNTQEEMNKQILSLVVLGKFYTPEYLRGTYEAQNPNLIGTTASELFSNQLSNWLSQISTNVDVGLNYRPGNQITDDEIELALSTQMFNDRVTINGNIGNNNNPYSTNQSQLVGDFEVNVKLIPSGKLQFKAYNRSNNNLIYETAPYTQGVGFSFTEDYNDFNDLLNKMKSLFTRNDEE
ncbi:MAG: translocation/assembly module TamB domain-containing protein [Tangfeifania sp.]